MMASEFPEVGWSCGPRNGPAANRNAAARLARGVWLIFLDDDCIPEHCWLGSYLLAIALSKKPGCLVGVTFSLGRRPSLLWEAPHYDKAGDMPPSCNFAVHRSLYGEMSGFDERFRVSFEDIDFFARLGSLGHTVNFIPDARVQHPLRKVPFAPTLVRRWEAKVIMAFDQGATPIRVLWGLPWHAFRVIQSRFHGCKWRHEDRLAAVLFAREWLGVFIRTPGWVRKWASQPRSCFWAERVSKVGHAPKYGF